MRCAVTAAQEKADTRFALDLPSELSLAADWSARSRARLHRFGVCALGRENKPKLIKNQAQIEM